MKVSEVGGVVRAYRKGTGVSQKELAGLIGISRATLNYLESGRDIEIGASKLLALLTLLGIPFSVPDAVDRDHDDKVLDRSVKAVKGKLTRKVVVEAFATGRPPAGSESALLRLMEEAPDEAVFAIVRAVSGGSGQPPKAVWKNARTLARQWGSTRALWSAEGQ